MEVAGKRVEKGRCNIIEYKLTALLVRSADRTFSTKLIRRHRCALFENTVTDHKISCRRQPGAQKQCQSPNINGVAGIPHS